MSRAKELAHQLRSKPWSMPSLAEYREIADLLDRLHDIESATTQMAATRDERRFLPGFAVVQCCDSSGALYLNYRHDNGFWLDVYPKRQGRCAAISVPDVDDGGHRE